LVPTESEPGSHRPASAHPPSIFLKRIHNRPPRHHRGVKDAAPWCPVAPRQSPRSRPVAAIAGRGSTWEGASRRARRGPATAAQARLCPAAPFGGSGRREGGWRREVGGAVARVSPAAPVGAWGRWYNV
jgi:hypothetical protein